MRVTHRSMYADFLTNMNKASSDLMELNMKSSSQKDVNKPSDDPLGTARILGYRDSLAALGQYQENIDTAKGWLNLADDTLVQSNTLLTRTKELAEQASTGTLTAENRDILAYEVRQLFDQMVSLSNTSFGGKSIFAGQDVGGDAFETGLMVYDGDGGVEPYVEDITGASDRSVKVQFLDTTGTSPATVGADAIDYRYTRDGGKTWTNNTLAASPVSPGNVLDLGDGLSVTLRDGYEVALSGVDNENTGVGSWLTVAPTAIYTGGNEDQSAATLSTSGAALPADFQALADGPFERDVTVEIVSGNLSSSPTDVTYRYSDDGTNWIPGSGATDIFTAKETSEGSAVLELPGGEVTINGTGNATGLTVDINAGAVPVLQMGSNVNVYGSGGFEQQTVVRIDNDPAVDMDPTADDIQYSYSQDGGNTWVTGKSVSNGTEPELFVPGGSLKLSVKGANDSLASGAQFVIQPKNADLAVDISADNRLSINDIGSDIFGGSPESGTGIYKSQDEEGSNIFVTMGKLIAALENNDQAAIGQSLDNLTVSQSQLMNHAANVGARENRLVVTENILSGLDLNQKERLSNIEDADIAELMTDLNKQEVVYQAVLTSSSKIMKMSLLDYI